MAPDLDALEADARTIIALHAAPAGTVELVCCAGPGVCGLLAWARRVAPDVQDEPEPEGQQ